MFNFKSLFNGLFVFEKERFLMKKIIAVCVLLMLFLSAFAFGSDVDSVFSVVYPEGYEVQEGYKVVYLTFDDGPAKYTPAILDILTEYDVPATFFVVGNTPYTHYISDIAENSHAIGLHSYSHNFGQIYSSMQAFFDDLQKIDDIVYELAGIRSKVMRFPGGSSARAGGAQRIMGELKKELHDRGYQYFDWNCDSSDKRGAKTASAAMRQIKLVDDNEEVVIVLMHDTQAITVEYLPLVIEYFRGLGYEFLPLCVGSPAVHHEW